MSHTCDGGNPSERDRIAACLKPSPSYQGCVTLRKTGHRRPTTGSGARPWHIFETRIPVALAAVMQFLTAGIVEVGYLPVPVQPDLC